MRLADFILANVEPILLEWESFARSIWPSGTTADPAEMRDEAEDILRIDSGHQHAGLHLSARLLRRWIRVDLRSIARDGESGQQQLWSGLAERALNVGKGRLNLGVNYQRNTFDKVQDRKLNEGDVTTYTGFVIGSTTAFFENKLFLNLNTDIVGLFATYGVSDRLDVGIALPIQARSVREAVCIRRAEGSCSATNVQGTEGNAPITVLYN